ncbi:MAG: hypothetical protein ACR2RF_29555 [Geminicoccaceae bacterium]
MFKVLILVCSLGLSEDECKNGNQLAAIDGPSFFGAFQCAIIGHAIIGDPESFDIDVRSRTHEPSFLRFRCVGEEVK